MWNVKVVKSKVQYNILLHCMDTLYGFGYTQPNENTLISLCHGFSFVLFSPFKWHRCRAASSRRCNISLFYYDFAFWSLLLCSRYFNPHGDMAFGLFVLILKWFKRRVAFFWLAQTLLACSGLKLERNPIINMAGAVRRSRMDVSGRGERREWKLKYRYGGGESCRV